MTKTSHRVAAILIALVLTTVTLPLLSALPVIANEAAPAVVLTEICFNPAFEENDYGLEASADVFEYVEFCNISDTSVSLAGIVLEHSTNGWDGDYRQNVILPPDDGDCMLAPGELAVIAIHTGDGFTAGLRTATAKDRRTFYERFVRFYDCADRLPRDHFYIADTRNQETGESLEGSFNLANSHEDVVLRITVGDDILCEVNYSAVEWNRNGYALNLTYRPGGQSGHPKASMPYNLGAYTPGLVRDNQLTDAGMHPTGDTIPLRVMQYNICATDSTQTDTDGTPITMDERIGHTFRIIEGYAPDILALCEINYLWTPRLMEEMTGEGCTYDGYGRSSKGSTYGSRRINRETWDLFNLILWNTEKYELVREDTFWCSETPDKPGTFTWEDGLVGDFARGINWVILRDRATGGEFFVLCAHIDAKVAEARRRSAALIVSKATELAEGRPILMLGDWNSNERATAYAELTADGFADARYRVPNPADMTLYGTTNSWGKYNDFLSRVPIDHCILTPHNVFVKSVTMDPGYFDEAKTLVSADHNATIFDLLLSVHHDHSVTAPSTDSLTEPATEPHTASADTSPTTVSPESSDITGAVTDDTSASAPGGCQSDVGFTLLTFLLTAVAVSILFCRRRRC